ncbi:MAG TPA: alpha-2-macroglobulin family protein, partial [Kofleriaceae bacterium]|nr:alpha-2-macroglobulin family protein [Kofleriaceae bacterium]
MRTTPMRTTLIMAGLALAGCKSKSDRAASGEAASAGSAGGGGAHLSQEEAERRSGLKVNLPAGAAAEIDARAEAKPAQAQKGLALPVASPAPASAPAKQKTPEGPTRAWFPETFLFEPLVVTDDAGAAVVPVRVPDRLTTWRVLALAHSRAGAQGGAVTSFLGTLPTYVDPVVPPFLVQGDEVRMPIQIINTTASDVASALEVSAQGATIRGAVGGARTVPAQGSTVDHATLVADRAGTVKLRIALGGTDAVEKSIEV